MPSEDTLRINTKSGEDLVFRRSAENSFSDWHHPTRRQYLIVLEGQMEVICGDGTTRQFQPGDVLLAEDMTGQGHQTRAINGSYRSVSMGILEDTLRINTKSGEDLVFRRSAENASATGTIPPAASTSSSSRGRWKSSAETAPPASSSPATCREP